MDGATLSFRSNAFMCWPYYYLFFTIAPASTTPNMHILEFGEGIYCKNLILVSAQPHIVYYIRQVVWSYVLLNLTIMGW